MADILTRNLTQKTAAHRDLLALDTQWRFDEQIIPKALQNVGHLFSHYSRHDASHSKQILVNIERILGNNLDLLTATDTWLILESAYWHDIGMLVTNDDFQVALNDPLFQAYVEDIRSSPHHELYQFCSTFRTTDSGSCFAGADSPMDAVRQFYFLMAEWFRRQHANRAGNIVENPWDSLGISSPRTELIPKRLFRLLGRICQMHGLPFDQIIAQDGLPYREAGLAQEDCHPRFVASLLRMGDLLDLDDNRFCPVMQRITGNARPRLTKAHEDKHNAVVHLRVDTERIEVTAECTSLDGYVEAHKWFDWLSEEMKDQMTRWQDIAPNRHLGLLPTLGTIKTSIKGESELLTEGERPQFTLDRKKAIELLQGKNLYDSVYASIREVLQNAVDSTLLRIWLSDRSKFSDDDWSSPLNCISLLRAFPIEIELIRESNQDPLATDKTNWKLVVTDKGTGITRDDLKFMTNIGSSQKNKHRRGLINSMPEWMKPSGAFGIGLQSIFMISDEIELTTKSIFSNEVLRVRLHAPLGDKEGMVLINRLPYDVALPFGTTIQIRIQLDKYATSWSRALGDSTSIASKLLTSHDPILDSEFPFDAATIADQVSSFAERSIVPVKGRIFLGPEEQLLGENSDPEPSYFDNWTFVKLDQSELLIRYKPLNPGQHPSLKARYRGQSFELGVGRLPHIWAEVDILSGSAGNILTANREKIVDSARGDFYKTVLNALKHRIADDIVTLPAEQRAVYSFLLKVMSLKFGDDWVALSHQLPDDWLDLTYSNSEHSFRSLFNRDTTWLVAESDRIRKIENVDLVLDGDWLDLTLDLLIVEWQKIGTNSVQVQERVIENMPSMLQPQVQYAFSREPATPYTPEALTARLAAMAKYVGHNCRLTINYQTPSLLALKSDTELNASNLFDMPIRSNHGLILLPFLFRTDGRHDQVDIEASDEQLAKLSKWIQPHLLSKHKLNEIEQAYSNLVTEIDNLMRDSRHWEVWRAARKL